MTQPYNGHQDGVDDDDDDDDDDIPGGPGGPGGGNVHHQTYNSGGDTVTLDDSPVPLASYNGDHDTIIEDTAVPLSDIPQTGIADMTGATGLLIISALVLAAMSKKVRQLITNEK